MAVTTINLSDPISTLVTKTNTISSDLGDKATLNTTATTDLVTAINEINTKVVAIDTDAEIGAKVEAFFAGNQLDVGSHGQGRPHGRVAETPSGHADPKKARRY